MARKEDILGGPLRPAADSALLRFDNGTIDVGGHLYYEVAPGQWVLVPETDPRFQGHEEWKRLCDQALERIQGLPAANRAARRAAARNKKRAAKARVARRKAKKEVRR